MNYIGLIAGNGGLGIVSDIHTNGTYFLFPFK
jgi:hypothetical protein